MLDKWEMSLNKKVCALDIDGVLNYYPIPWVNFIIARKAKPRGAIETCSPDIDITDLDFWKEALSYNEYRRLKEEYRVSGVKESLPVRPKARALLQLLNAEKYYITLISSRPVCKYPDLYRQTVMWLEINKLPYHDLLFSKDKDLEICRRAPHLKFIVEDHAYYANLVAQWGYKVFLVENRYNYEAVKLQVPNLIVMKGLGDVYEKVKAGSI